jgi:hypothetical protein
MRVVLLGSVRVVADGRESAVGGPLVRALLARLALAPGRMVTTRALAEALWPEDPPRHTRPALQSLVSRVAEEGFRVAGERWGLSLTLLFQAFAHTVAGRTGPATAALDEAEELTRRLGTHDDQRVWLAMVRIDLGDTDRARALLLDEVGAAASPDRAVLARICLADLARYGGDPELARDHLDRLGEGGDPAARALLGVGRAHLSCAEGDTGAAAGLLAEAFEHAAPMPDLPMLAHIAVGLADLRSRTGAPEEAAEFLGAAHTLRGGPGPRNPDVARLRRALADHGAAYERGRALDPRAARELLQRTCTRSDAPDPA